MSRLTDRFLDIVVSPRVVVVDIGGFARLLPYFLLFLLVWHQSGLEHVMVIRNGVRPLHVAMLPPPPRFHWGVSVFLWSVCIYIKVPRLLPKHI